MRLHTFPTILLAALLGCSPTPGDDPAPDDDTTPPDDDTAPPDDDTAPDDDTTPPPEVRAIVLMVIDTFRADHLGCGAPVGRMPRLEERIASGACFQTATSSASWTAPGTASILSGVHPSTHTLEEPGDTLAEDVDLLSDMVREAGWASFQKAGNNHASDSGIQPRFDANANTDVIDGYMRSEIDAEVVADSLALLDAYAITPESRWFLHAQFVAPHQPYCPPDTALETVYSGIDYCTTGSNGDLAQRCKTEGDVLEHTRQLYADEARYTDLQIADLMAGLEARGLVEHTLFVVTADHGEEFYEHGSWGHNSGVGREQIAVPLAFFGPGVPPGAALPGAASTVDIVPTLLDLAGLPPTPQAEGRSLVPLMDDPVRIPPYRAFSWDYLPATKDLRVWSITATGPDGDLWSFAMGQQATFLYHTETDPSQSLNVAGVPGNADVLELLERMKDESIFRWDDWVETYYGD